MKKLIKALCVILSVMLTSVFAGCGGNNEKKAQNGAEVNIAFQYGLGYAPLVVCKENKLIEENYKKMTGKDIKINWHQLSSGADINTGIASGKLDVGFMGLAPAITGISKHVGYKIFTSISCQAHGMMTNDPEVKNIGDLVGSKKQIAVVNMGSFQHLLMAMALVENGFDAHALDSNVVVMKHPDGMDALLRKSVSCHVTTTPYLFKERDNDKLYELKEVEKVWSSAGNSTHIGIAAERLYKENPKAYEAICKGLADAMTFIKNNPEKAAKVTSKYDGNSVEVETKYLKDGQYNAETKGIKKFASFMFKYGFVKEDVSDYSKLVFDNVRGD